MSGDIVEQVRAAGGVMVIPKTNSAAVRKAIKEGRLVGASASVSALHVKAQIEQVEIVWKVDLNTRRHSSDSPTIRERNDWIDADDADTALERLADWTSRSYLRVVEAPALSGNTRTIWRSVGQSVNGGSFVVVAETVELFDQFLGRDV